MLGVIFVAVPIALAVAITGAVNAGRYPAEVYQAAGYRRSVWSRQALGVLCPPIAVLWTAYYVARVRPRLRAADKRLTGGAHLRGYPPYPGLAAMLPPQNQPGWYADPEVEPIRVRWWDGAAWTKFRVQSRNYGLMVPVRRRRDRVVNRVMGAVAIWLLSTATLLAVEHLINRWDGDPASVYVSDLGVTENPKTMIASHCPASVISVKHYHGYAGRSDEQNWSVVPVPGHVGVAYFNARTGAVTCP